MTNFFKAGVDLVFGIFVGLCSLIIIISLIVWIIKIDYSFILDFIKNYWIYIIFGIIIFFPIWRAFTGSSPDE